MHVIGQEKGKDSQCPIFYWLPLKTASQYLSKKSNIRSTFSAKFMCVGEGEKGNTHTEAKVSRKNPSSRFTVPINNLELSYLGVKV